MTEVRPFRALRYDPARVELGRVIAPPYDVVAAEERARYWERDPHNAIRLELTRREEEQPETDYREVAERLAAWQGEGILRRDEGPALYALRQRFRAPDGSELVRDGFLGLLRLEPYERRMVLPHERTLSAPKADRLKLLRATRANLSSVFLLYEDRDDELAGLLAEPLAGATGVRDDRGVEHALAPIEDASSITAARAFLAKRSVVIADGHHRYETALAYCQERESMGGTEDAPHRWVLAYFANAFATGSLLLPIHRVLRARELPDDVPEPLAAWRVQSVTLEDAEAVAELLAQHLEPLRDRHAFALDDGSGRLRLYSRPAAAGELTIRVVHREVIEAVFGLDEEAVRTGAVQYAKSAEEAARMVRSAPPAVALYLNPLAPEDIFRVTRAGELLPQKSTFFYPKLPTGLVFRSLEEER